LAIGVLSHLSHPHPEIPKLELTGPLAGVAVIAPWTSLDERHSDKDVYSGGDVITPYVGRPWSRHYLGGAPRDYYTDASDAPSSWFETYPVKKILVLAGGNEILKPTIEDFVVNLKVSLSLVPGLPTRSIALTPAQRGFPSVEFFVGHREAHVAPIYNLYLGDSRETLQGEKLKAWLGENL
jgi:hypothetical protein